MNPRIGLVVLVFGGEAGQSRWPPFAPRSVHEYVLPTDGSSYGHHMQFDLVARLMKANGHLGQGFWITRSLVNDDVAPPLTIAQKPICLRAAVRMSEVGGIAVVSSHQPAVIRMQRTQLIGVHQHITAISKIG